MKKSSELGPAWFRKLASELARRNMGKIDVSVAQTSEDLGNLSEMVAEDCRCLPRSLRGTIIGSLWLHGLKRIAARDLAAAKRKK